MINLLVVSDLMPVPRDLELPLPLGEFELKIFLVLLFLVHILFVNLMLGGSVFSVIFEIIGFKFPRYDTLARRLAETITVNKSLAVVLGVGPLLCINLVYTLHFYSANALTGYAWIQIVPLVIIAFLASYLHKYTWDRWTGPRKRLHVSVGISAAFLFLCIPFLFLSNINLMLFPEQWRQVSGFFSSLRVGNVFPRYFHFISASLALTGLFASAWLSREKFRVENKLPGFSRPEIRRLFYRLAFYITLAQLVFGPLLLFTLPYRGVTGLLFIVILSGVAIALIVLLLLRAEIKATDDKIGRLLIPICILLTLVVLAMGTGRHIYREACLAEHKVLIADATARFRAIETATRMRLEAGLGAGNAIETGPTGEKVFENCAACHALNRVLAAPPLTEVAAIYKDNPDGIVAWTKNPGKKRPQFTPMPSFAHLGDVRLKMVAEYILEIASDSNSDE
jgi:cytochrome c